MAVVVLTMIVMPMAAVVTGVDDSDDICFETSIFVYFNSIQPNYSILKIKDAHSIFFALFAYII